MRWVTFADGRSGVERVGVVVGDEVRAMPAGPTMLEVLRGYGSEAGDLTGLGERTAAKPGDVFPLDMVRLLAPVPSPPTVRDFYAFEQHVKTARQRRGLEMDPDWYELPVFYFSNPYAVHASGEDVPIAPGSEQFDFELEVAAVVGRAGEDLSPEDAESHIAGFCVMNDWSARDVQRREMKLSMGPVKGKDTATTLGPWLVTPDELEDRRSGNAYDLTMTASVNGREYSRASLADIYWSFGHMLAYASRGTRIEPGDVIGSGTCGTGCILELSLVHGEDAYPWLRAGDVVTLEVEGIGSITNQVVEGHPVVPLR
jgi:2-keto-4-pentenoate hydratase/2-oxohepta-3-ene-1,7-dioic acid hydratase in catechol pathway